MNALGSFFAPRLACANYLSCTSISKYPAEGTHPTDIQARLAPLYLLCVRRVLPEGGYALWRCRGPLLRDAQRVLLRPWLPHVLQPRHPQQEPGETAVHGWDCLPECIGCPSAEREMGGRICVHVVCHKARLVAVLSRSDTVK